MFPSSSSYSDSSLSSTKGEIYIFHSVLESLPSTSSNESLVARGSYHEIDPNLVIHLTPSQQHLKYLRLSNLSNKHLFLQRKSSSCTFQSTIWHGESSQLIT